MVNLLRRPWWRGFAIALLLISLGLNSCQSLSPEPHSSQSNHILEFVPKQALLAAVVDTTVKPGKTWQKSHLTEVLSQTIDSFFTPLAINPRADIRPWLGKTIAFAITDQDLDRDRDNGRQTGYLLVTDTTDDEKLREFLELFWQRQTIAGSHPVFTEGSSVPIISGTLAQSTQQLATAIVGGSTLLVANDVRVLRQSLRVAQAPALQISGPDCCTPVWLNLHIPDLIDWLGLATPERQLLSSLQGQQLSATTTMKPQQLVINTRLTTLAAALGPHEFEPAPDKPDPTAVPDIDHSKPQQYLPASVAWAAMGYDLRPLWTELRAQIGHYQGLPFPLQQGLQWPSTQLAQSLSGPLHQLLSRDYAIGQLNDGTWLMAVTSPNPTVIKQLDSIATQQGLTVSQLTLEDRAVTAWSRLKTRVDKRNRETTVETDLVGIHTKVDDCEVFATSIGGLTVALAAPAHPLSTTQRFQRTTQSMDKPNQGYIYGTWSELDRLLESNRWFSLVRPIVQPWSQSIEAISITSYVQTAHQSTGTVSVLLKN
ncbi:DUF3352 domain-containing protein [Leptothoe sp. PORK10 BA2]|uniref:DUF3352 domain-containing protein n=1 Tax=Leptothoe sp. PORK10 BA2 TaxID=3110254 RepID=UPI002B1EC2B9|nr:DUF3352 domain-containing protein [Leptothoe sp. PORK10 BA2]MEA5465181.1 DUF3352 domain-containing protein [Leptothoe sp. PORK10 BA2]